MFKNLTVLPGHLLYYPTVYIKYFVYFSSCANSSLFQIAFLISQQFFLPVRNNCMSPHYLLLDLNKPIPFNCQLKRYTLFLSRSSLIFINGPSASTFPYMSLTLFLHQDCIVCRQTFLHPLTHSGEH